MREASVLDALGPIHRAELLDRGVHRSLGRDEIIHLAGEQTTRVHVVLHGIIKLCARDINGDETILGLTVPQGIVGDIGAADDGPQPLDAITVTECTVVGLDRFIFTDIVFAHPPAARMLAREAAARTRWMIDTALERTSGEVDERIAGRLLDLARLLGRPVGTTIELDLPLGQRELGKLAGVCRESACKSLRRMKRSGVVDYEGRRLRILRPDSLKMLRCGGAIDPS